MGSCFGDPFQPAIELALGECDTCVAVFGPDKDQCRITLFPLLGCIDLLASYEQGTRRMGPAAASFAPQVADLLKSSDDGIRRSAAEALGNTGPAAASTKKSRM